MEMVSFNGRDFYQLRDANGDFSLVVSTPASDPSNRIGFEISLWRGIHGSATGVRLGTMASKDVMATDSGTTWNFHSGETARQMWHDSVCEFIHERLNTPPTATWQNRLTMFVKARTVHQDLNTLVTTIQGRVRAEQARLDREAAKSSSESSE